MRIEKITIKNFRSFENQTVDFYDLWKPITIIWENNAWKSNVIKAILWWLWQKYIWEDNIKDSDFHKENIWQKININVELDFNWKKVIEFSSWDDFRDRANILCNWRYFWKKDKDPILDKLFFYDFQQVANLLKVKSWFSYTPLGKIVKQIKENFKTDRTLKESMNQEIDKFIQSQIAVNQDYQNFKEKLWKCIKKNLKNHSEDFDFKHTIQDVDKIINWLSFFVQENKDKPLISVDNFWSWFRSLLVFSIFEAISESNEWGNVYIFEEPETFLHENFEEYFYSLLEKLAENNQVIITTHSKKFVNIFETGTIIRLNNNETTDHKTICNQKRMDQALIDNINKKVLLDGEWNEILRYPDQYWSYMKAIEPNIWLIAFSKKIVIVEWPHDLLAYKTAFGKKLLDDWYITNSLWYLWVNIVCVHNKSLIWPLLYICKILGTQAFAVFDSDLPVPQTINELDDYLSEVLDYKQADPYFSLDTKRKQHYTKTIKIISIAKKLDMSYQINRPKIEWVLNYEVDDPYKLSYKNKSSISIFDKLDWKEYTAIKTEYPEFISNELESFVFESVLTP